MGKVHIVTDGTARFSVPDFKGRELVPIAPVQVESKLGSLEDGPETDLALARPLFENGAGLPHTRPPSTEMFIDIFQRLQSQTDQIVSIHTSAALTQTFQNAMRASSQFMGRCDIQVINSLSIGFGLGLLTQAAARAAVQGQNLDNVIRIIRGMLPRLYMVFFLDNLHYLEHHGLVSRSQAVLGNMLGIIPFLTMENGHMIPMEKVRSRLRANEKLLEFVSEFSQIEHLAILQPSSEPSDEALSVAERVRVLHPHAPITIDTYGASMATYVGLNSLGVVVLENEEDML